MEITVRQVSDGVEALRVRLPQARPVSQVLSDYRFGQPVDVVVDGTYWGPWDDSQALVVQIVPAEVAGVPVEGPTRTEIVKAIFDEIQADVPRVLRLMAAVDAMPSITMVLDNKNYPLARYCINGMRERGLIDDEDVALMLRYIP